MVFLAGVIFLVGLLMVIGGIRIIRDKMFWSFPRKAPYPRTKHTWELPAMVSGKSAVRSGIGYVISGILVMLFSVFLFYVAL